jgi:hypothetical protein
MKKLTLDNENKHACLRVLEYVSENMPFKREEFKLLDGAIKWINSPRSQFTFQFNIRLSSNGESGNVDIEYDGWQFAMSQYNVSNFPDVGSDWYYTYEFKCSPEETEEDGAVNNWEESAMDLLGYYEQEDNCNMLKVTISKFD